MAYESLVIDPAGSAIGGGDPGSPLIIGPGSQFGQVAGDYPAPQRIVTFASSASTEGEVPGGGRYSNRTVVLRFKFLDPSGTLLSALRQKYAKLQAEGGVLRRTMKDGSVRFYDLLPAPDGWSPIYDFSYYLAHVTEVEMTLPARPFSRGAEVDMGDNVETVSPVLIFVESGIAGEVPALGRLVIDEDQSQVRRTVLWGLQSRDYSSAGTAALFYEAEALSAIGASIATGPAGASGGGTNNTLANLSLTTSLAAQWALNGTHAGIFRVIGRFRVPVTNTGTVSVQLLSQLRLDPLITRNAITIEPTANEGFWILLDLGEVMAPRASKGDQTLYLELRAASTVAGDDLYTDWIALVPVAEGSGRASGSAAASVDPVYPLSAGGSLQIDHQSVEGKTSGGTTWGRPKSYEGDYLLVPPAGAEGRSVRMIVFASRGRLINVDPGSPVGLNHDDPAADDISARLFVTPRYLT